MSDIRGSDTTRKYVRVIRSTSVEVIFISPQLNYMVVSNARIYFKVCL